MLKPSLLVITSLLSLQAVAGTQVWDFSGSELVGNSGDGNTFTLNQDGVSVSVSGWSNTGTYEGQFLESGELVFYGDHLGLINRDEDGGQPNHSIDSFYNGDFDAILLEFSEEVDLEGFSIGWAEENYGSWTARGADISIAAGTYGFADNAGMTWNNILSNGWSSVGNYGDVAENSYQAMNSEVKSQFWLISVYNPAFGNESWSTENEGFKLKGFATKTEPKTEKPPAVPEPSVLALFAIGLLSLIRIRKKQVG